MAESNSFNDFVTCPYDKAHRVLKGRLAKHLIKCSRNLGISEEWTICPCNTTHHIKRKDFAEHQKECPEANWLRASTVRSDNGNGQQSVKPVLVECDENWDDEPPVEAYDPSVYCEENAIIRTLQGHSKAARKEFRESERRRLANKK
ncbi:gametocyte-specific factor 1 homolog [Drosophila sulfurigaster albostrigata]|uniref:gametocyte-specific factor 1 homolog n=1 Tax=Drosophila sulfurigaster albostrigata TaxID=89887 RepID=UPI002D2187EB|nr:gametocyte-specific factor 1 homolog [Drosophila sulfurigaster albostrigata]